MMTGEFAVEEAVSLALRLEVSVLSIQGLFGIGKIYTGAQIAVALMAQGRRVGVTAPSHKAIHNLLDEIEKVAGDAGVRFRGFKRGDGDDAFDSKLGDASTIESVGNDKCEGADEDVLLIAGTSWL